MKYLSLYRALIRNRIRALIKEALDAWLIEADSYTNEIARTKFLKAQVARRLNNFPEAERLSAEAGALRTDILSQYPQSKEQLCQADFDSLVTFWSK